MRSKFKDFRCLGGWLTVKWRPTLLVWWSKDATPPSNSNPGIWLIGSWLKMVCCVVMAACAGVASQWPASTEINIPAGKIEEANFCGDRVQIIKRTNGFFLVRYPTFKPANTHCYE